MNIRKCRIEILSKKETRTIHLLVEIAHNTNKSGKIIFEKYSIFIIEDKFKINNRTMNIITLCILLMGLGLLILFGIGLFRKKKFKGYLKVLNLFEGGFESED